MLELEVSPYSYCCQGNFPTGTIKLYCIVSSMYLLITRHKDKSIFIILITTAKTKPKRHNTTSIKYCRQEALKPATNTKFLTYFVYLLYENMCIHLADFQF